MVGAGPPTGWSCPVATRMGVAVRISTRPPRRGRPHVRWLFSANTLSFYRQVGLADAVVASGGKKSRGSPLEFGQERSPTPFLGAIGEGCEPISLCAVCIHKTSTSAAARSSGRRTECSRRRTQLAGFQGPRRPTSLRE